MLYSGVISVTVWQGSVHMDLLVISDKQPLLLYSIKVTEIEARFRNRTTSNIQYMAFCIQFECFEWHFKWHLAWQSVLTDCSDNCSNCPLFIIGNSYQHSEKSLNLRVCYSSIIRISLRHLIIILNCL